MAKNRGFSKLSGREKFFHKKTFAPSFSTFHCRFFEPSYTHIPLTVFSLQQKHDSNHDHLTKSMALNMFILQKI